jgi:hypothetical protein
LSGGVHHHHGHSQGHSHSHDADHDHNDAQRIVTRSFVVVLEFFESALAAESAP